MGPIRAIYENGVFKPKGPVSYPEGCEITLTLRAIISADGKTRMILDPEEDTLFPGDDMSNDDDSPELRPDRG